MKVAIQTNVWSAERHKNLDDVFNEIARTGYDGFEIGAHRIDLTQPDQFRALASKHKLRVAGLHIHGELHNPGAMDERFTFAQGVAAFAAQVAAPFVLISSKPKDSKTQQEFQHEADSLNRLGEICAGKGVQLLYHNHNWELVNDYAEYHFIADHTKPELVAFGLDVGWVTRAGYKPVEFIKQFEKRIAYFHIKDTLPEGKWTEVGKGIVDFKSILALLKELKRDDWLTVERDETLVQAFESAKDSREALRALGI